MHVAIIGGGLSGSLACMELLRRSERIRIVLIERRSRQLNRGVAYSARLSRQLLNVPAARMGLFADDTEGFLRWARSGPVPHAGPDDFLPRSLYGDHVHDQFNELLDQHPGRVEVVRADAVSLGHHPARGYGIGLHNGRTIRADAVVLAMGNAPPAHVPNLGEGVQEHPGYIAWPWKHGALSTIKADDAVLFAGSGLTMVDVVLSMIDQGHRGRITVVSRRGQLPRPHAEPGQWALTEPLPRPDEMTALGLTRWVRREARLAASLNVPWQHVMDAVKPLVQQWWQAMDIAERERFLRHVRPFWEVHRHRMPREAHVRLIELQASGRLRLLAASISLVNKGPRGLLAGLVHRGSGRTEMIEAAHVINCTGPQADTRRMEQPLLRNLLQQGFASWDGLHLGLRTDPSGALVDDEGQLSEGLFTIGPLCKATLWECTAVPEIREQAHALAQRLAVASTAVRSTRRSGLRRLFDRLAMTAT